MNDFPSGMPFGTTLTATDVRNWFGRDAPALSEAACERLAALVQRLATPHHLLQPTPAYAAYRARGWPKKLDPVPDEMLWHPRAANDAVKTLRDIVPKLRAWDDLLASPETREAHAAADRLDEALVEALPHLERAWGRCIPNHRKKPKAWHTPAVVIAGAFEEELHGAGRKISRGPKAVFWNAVANALAHVGHKQETATIFQHVDRLRKRLRSHGGGKSRQRTKR